MSQSTSQLIELSVIHSHHEAIVMIRGSSHHVGFES
jgi:hypothetical protein